MTRGALEKRFRTRGWCAGECGGGARVTAGINELWCNDGYERGWWWGGVERPPRGTPMMVLEHPLHSLSLSLLLLRKHHVMWLFFFLELITRLLCFDRKTFSFFDEVVFFFDPLTFFSSRKECTKSFIRHP